MKVKNIQQVNEAVFILKHFIDLSSRLLPILFSLDQKISPSKSEERDKKRILDVFNTYKFDTNTSQVLLESDILFLIRKCYLEILNEESMHKRESLSAFLKEYNRLKNNWRLVENN